jgi:hypothetical protein
MKEKSTTKIKLKLESPIKKFEFQEGQPKIEILPLTKEREIALIETYLEGIFDTTVPISERFVGAKYALILAIIDLFTNIDIGNGEQIDAIISSGLWSEIKNRLDWYYDFEYLLETIVKSIKEDAVLENSMSHSFNKLTTKASQFLDNLLKLDLSDNGIQQISGLLNNLKEQTNTLKETLQIEDKSSAIVETSPVVNEVPPKRGRRKVK